MFFPESRQPIGIFPCTRVWCGLFKPAPPCLAAAFLLDERTYSTITQDCFEPCPGEEPYQSFDPYAAHFDPSPAFAGPPTPPNTHPIVHNGQFHPPHDLHSAAALAFGASPVDDSYLRKLEPNGDADANTRQGSNSAEEDDSTPAQAKRKAQNRAA